MAPQRPLIQRVRAPGFPFLQQDDQALTDPVRPDSHSGIDTGRGAGVRAEKKKNSDDTGERDKRLVHGEVAGDNTADQHESRCPFGNSERVYLPRLAPLLQG